MKIIKYTLIAAFLQLAIFGPCHLSAQNPTASPENPAHQELRQLRDGLLAAMNKGDLESTLKYLHTNCVITWHNAEVSRGHQGVRDYYNRVMTGPTRLVESFNCSVDVDELAMLYGDNVGICFGSSGEHFKLTNGRKLDFKGRWTATLVKDNGRWLIASLHASTNLFDNVILDLLKKTVKIVALVSILVGLFLGWFVARRRKTIPASA